MNVLFLPFILQGICILVDEFYFHEQRGLKTWEKIGHPLDTLTVVLCYSYLLWGNGDTTTYIVLCALSCVFITKDEFVHSTACPAAENWLHSLLFLLHPICFFCAYLLKSEGQIEFLRIQTIVVFIFMFYQALRWSYPWRMQTK